MTAHTTDAFASDADLWRLVLEGNTSAFEVLVRRHQSLVSAVAFSACGNLALSEDVGAGDILDGLASALRWNSRAV